MGHRLGLTGLRLDWGSRWWRCLRNSIWSPLPNSLRNLTSNFSKSLLKIFYTSSAIFLNQILNKENLPITKQGFWGFGPQNPKTPRNLTGNWIRNKKEFIDLSLQLFRWVSARYESLKWEFSLSSCHQRLQLLINCPMRGLVYRSKCSTLCKSKHLR